MTFRSLFLLWLLPLFAFGDLVIAKKFFENGDYEKLIKELEADLFPSSKLGSKEADVEAYKLLGAAYLMSANPDKIKAKSAFDSVLRLDPEATLDTLRFPPGVVAVFNEVKKDSDEAKIAVARKTTMRRFGQGVSNGLEMLKRQEDLTPKYYAVVIEQQNVALSFVPILGQFQNQQHAKGFGFLGAEALFIGTTAGTFLYLQKITSDNGQGGVQCDVADIDLLDAQQICNLARNVNLISATLALITAGVSVYDSQRNFQEQRFQLQELPPEIGRSLQKKTAQLQLTPSLDRRSVGVGLVGRF
jgi:tetratricopeptide (TPR) repeat protein